MFGTRSNCCFHVDIWFHRYDENGKDIEGRCKIKKTDDINESAANQILDDYNSWKESFWGRWKRRSLDKNVILAEGTSPAYFQWMIAI